METAVAPSLERSTRLLRALADPVRLRILNLLAGDREVCVCHLHEALELPQPTVSRHLAYLRDHLGESFANGVIIHCGKQATPLGDRITALPVNSLWS